jgi:hypothetical protein
MSMFESGNYRWRETCFVLFDVANRPSLEKMHRVLSSINEQYVLTNLSADEQAFFDSMSILSPEDFSALDICYVEGDEVIEQTAELAKEMDPVACAESLPEGIERIKKYTARFDVLHFEQTALSDGQEDEDAMLDPSTLLLVLATLAKMTGGVAVDPQSGSIITDE